MADRTYPYFKGHALFPFGYGLSYTKFVYDKPKFSASQIGPVDMLHLSVPIRNTGAWDGDEVVQVYVKHLKSKVPQPLHSLCAFQRLFVPKGQVRTAAFDVNPQTFRYWDVAKKAYVVEPGLYEIQIGASSADIRSRQIVMLIGK